MNKPDNALKIFLAILLGTFVFASLVHAQNNYQRKISISAWIKEMEACKKPLYYLENTEIFYDANQDSLYSFMQPRNEPTAKDKIQEKNIYPTVIMQNCKLPDNKTCQIRNLIFHQNITFGMCEGAAQLIFYNCTFHQGIDFHLSNLKILQFMYCTLLQRIVINEIESSMIHFSNCSFYTDDKIITSTYQFGDEQENQTYQYLINIRQNEKKITAFNLSNCQLLPTPVTPIISFNGGKYDNIAFQEFDFSNSILDFTQCSVKENFTVRDCKFSRPPCMYQFNFPKDNTSFHWSQLDSVGIAIYTYYDLPPYTSKTDTLISNVYFFNELNSSYRKFFSMYRNQGDMESANACFKQLKDMETRKYRQLYKQNPGVQTWFNWRFNQFLKNFSEYGTNPVQALIISMWTILAFAAMYFFFYSDWDGINRPFLIKQHRTIMQYFRSEQRLEDFYTANYKEELKNFADYKKEMAESKVELPVFIILLGKPLYLLSIIKHKLLTLIYRRTELLQGRWIDLQPARKIFVAITVGFAIMIYLFYLVIVRALNSTTLSINAFSTLGFGAIPVKGLSRYITILEGFLGWFLLSIFSVSLISQMLQN